MLTAMMAVAGWGQWRQFGVEARLVQAPVVVTGADGKVVEGIEADEWVLLDNGREQKVTVDTIETGLAPVSLAVLVQTSGITAAAIEKVAKIGAMIQPLVTGERGCAMVGAFAESVEWMGDCTSNADEIDVAFRRLRPGEPRAGRMLDAVGEAIGKLRARPKSRQVILLISESRDRGSEMALAEAVRQCESESVSIYAFNYSAFLTGFTSKTAPITRLPFGVRRNGTGRHVPGSPPTFDRHARATEPEQRVDLLAAGEELSRLDQTNTSLLLSTLTGGRVLKFAKQAGLEDVVQELGSELRSSSVLSFAPDDKTAGFHRIEVRLKRPGTYTYRVRAGYWVEGP